MRNVNPMVHSKRLVAMIVAIVVGLPTLAWAGPRQDADHYEMYFPAGDGTTLLHADVLRPHGIGSEVRTPVIMTVSPYMNQGAGFSPLDTRPNERFYDFLDLTKILDKGYTYVMVDLPGFGGSSGCNDWGGLREQGAVEAAVEWAAQQPWSTGKVGLLGKSYDAWTGLMGIARQPKGLAAVVSMEPVYSGYRYLYNNGVRLPNSLSTPFTFQLLDAQPGTMTSKFWYQVNGAPQLWCYGPNALLQQIDEERSPFWTERDLTKPTIGKKTPLFLTQGFLDSNTKPDAAFDLFNGLSGPNRAWFGQFDHVRGWEKAGKRFQTGRSGFVKELMRFLDHYVKGVPLHKAPVHKDPAVAVQDNFGRYRAEKRWPPSDSRTLWSRLNGGSYTDNATNSGTGAAAGNGIWTFSQPLRNDAWMSGEPQLDVTVETVLPRANLVGDLYDVAPNGEATIVSRGALLLREIGDQHVTFEMYGQDWVFGKGHRIGVLVTGANADWWVHLPTGSDVSVVSAEIGMPFLRNRRTDFLDGGSTPRLEMHKRSAVVSVEPSTIQASMKPFKVPPPLA